MDQATHGRFTPSAWRYLQQQVLSEEQGEDLRYLISIKTETITYDEIVEMVHIVSTFSQQVPKTST